MKKSKGAICLLYYNVSATIPAHIQHIYLEEKTVLFLFNFNYIFLYLFF